MRKLRAIPENIKRQVRRECRFGCVICGAPLFDYDHMIPFSAVGEHTVENIALLCRNHHIDKTARRLSLDRVIEGRRNPFNLSRFHTATHKIEANRQIMFSAGSNSVWTTFPLGHGVHHALWCNGFDMVAIEAEEHWLTISMVVTDSNGRLLLHVDKGEIALATGVWDYTYQGTKMKIWAGKRNILFDADISNDAFKINKGMFLDGGGDGFVAQNGTLVEVVEFKGVGYSMGCRATNNAGGGWGMVNRKRYPDLVPPGGFGFFRSVTSQNS